MRKLGIIIAIAAVATLGFAGKASAQLEPLCDVPQAIADGSDQDPIAPFPGGPGTPVKQITQGAADACNEQDIVPLICGVADGIEGMSGGDPLSAGIKENVGCAAPPTGDDDDDDDKKAKKDKKKGDPEVEGEVVDRNAAPGGTLPRTGGELQLLGGLSMGLTGLGVFARRFLR